MLGQSPLITENIGKRLEEFMEARRTHRAKSLVAMENQDQCLESAA